MLQLAKISNKECRVNIITVALLKGQSENEEKREMGMKVFDEKLKIYKDFLSKLHDVIKDGNITNEEVKELIFQISFVAMHTSSGKVNLILMNLKKTIDEMQGDQAENETLAKNILCIVSILQEELYRKKLLDYKDSKNKEVIEVKATFFAELVSKMAEKTKVEEQSEETQDSSTSFDKYKAQGYFWEKLTDQLRGKYDIPYKNYTEDISRFYLPKKRYRHRWYGFSFEVCKSKVGVPINFFTEVGNDYYFGFVMPKEVDEKQFDKNVFKNCIKSSLDNCNFNANGTGYRRPSTKNALDFWYLSPKANFERISDPNTQEQFIKEVAIEMDEYIKKFIKEVQSSSL